MTATINEDSILELLKDDSKFSAKIGELTRARQNLDQARKDANAAMAELTRKRVETDNYINGRKAELSARQLEHDKAAKEAADRIEAGRGQMAEVQRVSAEVNALKSDLDGRERDLARREKLLKETLDSLAGRQQVLDKATDLVRRQQAHIAAMPRQ